MIKKLQIKLIKLAVIILTTITAKVERRKAL